jgi:hypothetical protein
MARRTMPRRTKKRREDLFPSPLLLPLTSGGLSGSHLLLPYRVMARAAPRAEKKPDMTAVPTIHQAAVAEAWRMFSAS